MVNTQGHVMLEKRPLYTMVLGMGHSCIFSLQIPSFVELNSVKPKCADQLAIVFSLKITYCGESTIDHCPRVSPHVFLHFLLTLIRSVGCP